MDQDKKADSAITEEHVVVASNSIYSLLRLISKSVMAFFISVFFVRILGAQNYGLFSLVTIYWSVFEGLSTFGMSNLIAYAVAKFRAERRPDKLKWAVDHYLRLTIIGSVTLSIVMFLLSTIIGYEYNSSEMALLLRILSLGLVFFVLSDQFIPNLFQGVQKMKYTFVSGVTFDALRGAQILLVVLGAGLLGAIYFYDIIYVIIAAISIYFLYKTLHNTKKSTPISGLEKKEFKHYALFSYINTMSGYLYGPVIVLLLGFFASSQISYVTFYRVGLLMSGIISMPAGAISSAFFATITKYIHRKQYTKFYKMQSTLIRYSVLTTFPLVFGSLVAVTQIITFLYHASLAGTITPFIILLIPVFLASLFSPITLFLSAIGKQKYFMYTNVFSAAFGIILTIILVPLFFATGAAITYVTVGVCALLLNLYYVSHYIEIRLPYGSIIKGLLASALMSLYVYGLLTIVPLWTLPFVLISGLVLYLAVLYIIKAVNMVDIRFLLRMTKLDKLLHL